MASSRTVRRCVTSPSVCFAQDGLPIATIAINKFFISNAQYSPGPHPFLHINFLSFAVIREFKPPMNKGWVLVLYHRRPDIRTNSLSLGFIYLSTEPGEEKSDCVDFLIKPQRWGHRVH